MNRKHSFKMWSTKPDNEIFFKAPLSGFLCEIGYNLYLITKRCIRISSGMPFWVKFCSCDFMCW